MPFGTSSLTLRVVPTPPVGPRDPEECLDAGNLAAGSPTHILLRSMDELLSIVFAGCSLDSFVVVSH